ncbi:MAG: glycosyltransferase family 4 protein [Crocinitomicaceae bacterium]|nr:glycosyltransferase family 4 protein [Crocinitomicaceae bacterium]
MIKVCHFSSVHKAGDTRIFVKECRSLAKAGYDVSLVVTNTTEEITDGVRVINVPFKGGRLLRMFRASAMVYKKALEQNADIYHFHDAELLKFGVKLARMGKKVIYDSHEDLPRQLTHKHYIPKFLHPILTPLVETWENKKVKQLSAIVAATPVIRNRFLKIHSNTVDVCNFPNLEELTSPVSFDKKKNQACYIGSITEVRGIRELMNAMEISNYSLVLGGVIDPPELRDSLEKYEGWKKTSYLGFLNRNQVKSVLDSSKIGLLPLHKVRNYVDSLPVKMFEYMAAGIPFIATDIPSWYPYILEHKCGVVVDIFDKKKFGEKINDLFADEKKSIEMGKNGRRAVETLYNWANEEKKLLRLYHSLSSGS